MVFFMLQNSEEKKEREIDQALGDSGVSKVIERNIRTIMKLRVREANKRSAEDKVADKVTGFSGTMIFVYIHIFWFALWLVLNTGIFGLKPFDPFPYGLLTMVVNLEAIFLSAFLLISQNRSNNENMTRAELDMHVSLLTEHELTQVLEMLETIEKKMGITEEKKEELSDLEKETKPEDVLAEINRLQQIIR